MRSIRITRVLLSLAALLPSAALAGQVELFDGREVAGIVHSGERPAQLAAELLARDLTQLTGMTPRVSGDLATCGRLCVVLGPQDSALIREVARETGIDLTELCGQWERYTRLLVRSKRDPSRRYLLIAGSDMRGAIWGVVDLTREIGVSPWEWWADVTPRRVKRLAVDGSRRLSPAPSVQYRGIFLNDEDWGLQPWAAKTYEPETGDIGPKTYVRIFELMWRLKANLIWPAMHDSTKPFYQIPGNAEAARDHAIVVGTSHAEPMMRNNVREWEEQDGDFNFFTNRNKMVDYWRRRAEEVKGFENIYTIGLRGKHDSAMEGADTPEKARQAMTEVMAIQRELLATAQGKPADQVPQVLTLYKEVLDIYGTGLKVPDDVTLVWPEDNYGYINRLSNPAERKRSGGSGIYYHISYWGRPHDYLWLGTTHPALIREQLDRAWQMDARKLWVVNVGDIKPGEYLTQYFLDLAFDTQAITPAPDAHLTRWAADQFSGANAAEIAAIMTEYYDLAFERRPEFMGFGQTEPTRPNKIGDYIRTGGGEALARIDRYRAITARAEALTTTLPADRRDAFFQLVLYPVRAAASLNERNLRLDLASLYTRQGRTSINAHVEQAKTAHARIVADTAAYNSQNSGKWRGMMDMAPRRLPVFDEPLYPQVTTPPDARRTTAPNAAAGIDRIVSLSATSASASDWEIVPGLGSRGGALRAKLDLPSRADAAGVAPLDYRFDVSATGDAELRIVAIPVHPLTSENGLRIAVQLDDGLVQLLDFRTFGRSEEWKQNVLTNTAVRTIPIRQLAKGAHRLRIHALDPGFILDRIDVRLDGAPDYYGAPPVK
ncbi:glycosyl hydrolase 115 family protein [Sphingomonas sp. BT-65]|uniref:glycosyl hydrolase 115 family protein n=1 Tax=Sphingomonas sp. BT-65 TaxID=2989821 RepID=UPI00223585C5|nr:glycosyl hydrolase 115 family protein [Sphingomonas sp. BT-65]MCW4462901.1 glycosyl hydrolase 115 family protein [Sphingomonas sp. BT-65]